MKKRTKYITLRLPLEEYAAITDKLPPHVSVSQYIRSALKEYSGNGSFQPFTRTTSINSRTSVVT